MKPARPGEGPGAVGAPLGDGGGEGGAAPGGGAREGRPPNPSTSASASTPANIKEGEDFFGRNVIMAARVASRAHGGEILASAVVKTLTQGSHVAWGEMSVVELKGLSGEQEIWAAEWRKAS